MQAHSERGFVPYLAGGNDAVVSATLSPLARERRRNELGIGAVVDNGPALASYDAPPVVQKVHDPIEQEAKRLAETIRTEHKRVSASCDGSSAPFTVPGWSSQEVFYRALAILNKEGLTLGSASVCEDGWKVWFRAS